MSMIALSTQDHNEAKVTTQEDNGLEGLLPGQDSICDCAVSIPVDADSNILGQLTMILEACV